MRLFLGCIFMKRLKCRGLINEWLNDVYCYGLSSSD
jgi:hypothetical protein